MSVPASESGIGSVQIIEADASMDPALELPGYRRRNRRLRRQIGRVAAVVSTATFAACGGSGSGSPRTTPTNPNARVRQTGPNSVNQVTITRTVTAIANTNPNRPPAPPVSPPCTYNHLRVTVGGGKGAAGSEFVPILFTNVGRKACSLYGFPGVSARRRGRQVGEAAVRDHSIAPHSVTLRPGYDVIASLQIGNAANYPPERCKPEQATHLRVYPPGSYDYASIPTNFTACAAAHLALMYVKPVEK